MTEPTTDHDLLIRVVNDVSHMRDSVAQLDASFQGHTTALDKQHEDDEKRIRILENQQTRLLTRWRAVGWISALVATLCGVVGLIQLLT